jgi:hypothetical protein
MISLISLLVVLILSILATRMATDAPPLTGPSRASANFLARSAFTTEGFTTNGSEKVVREEKQQDQPGLIRGGEVVIEKHPAPWLTPMILFEGC